jgi:hypothetical protein
MRMDLDPHLHRGRQLVDRGFSMFAPPSCVQEEMVEQGFSVPSAPTKTAATQRTSQRAVASNQQSGRVDPSI